MYVCICKGITEKQLTEAVISRSHQNSKEILRSLGVGSDCGTCLEEAISKIQSQYRHSTNSSKTPFQSHIKQN